MQHLTWQESASLGLKVVTSFSYFPLRIATYLGFTSAAIVSIWIAVLLFNYLRHGFPVEVSPSIMVTISFFTSVQLICIGATGEPMGRTYREVQARSLYIVDHDSSDARVD